MSWYYDRLDRLRRMVAECITKDLNPSKVGFADYITHLGASFGLRPSTVKEHIISLVEAYHYDAWVSYVRENAYIPKEKQEDWFLKHIKQITGEVKQAWMNQLSKKP